MKSEKIASEKIVKETRTSGKDKVPVKRRRTAMPTLSSALTDAFTPLDGGWQSYIRFVHIAAKAEPPDKPGDMTALYNCHQALSKAKQQSMTPEALCLEAGINITTLIGSIMPDIWIYSGTKAAVIKAACNPAVVAKTAKAAMGQGKFAHKDRETFLKITGELQTNRGSNVQVNNNLTANAASGASSGLPLKLPSAGQAVMELEAADADDDTDTDEV